MKTIEIKDRKGLTKVKDYLDKNSWLFESTNLKMYDACYYDYEEDYPRCYEENKEYFYDWCEDMYQMFTDDMTSEGVDYEKVLSDNRIGRTSSFYLTDFQNNNDIGDIICEVIYDHFDGMVDCVDIRFDTNEILVTTYEDEIEDIEYEEYFETKLYEDLEYKLEDSKIVGDYINSLKRNQVESFKDWLECQEENLEIEENERVKEVKEEKTRVKKEKEEYLDCIINDFTVEVIDKILDNKKINLDDNTILEIEKSIVDYCDEYKKIIKEREVA